MSIHVTPIPRLATFAAPDLTLGTSNSAGNSGAVIASNSTLLAYDTTVPTNVTYTSAATGSSGTAARRDHTHGFGGLAGWNVCCRVYHDASQTISDDTLTALAFNQETFDTSSMHDTSTNNSRLVATPAGVYFVWGDVRFAANASGERQILIRVNGSTLVSNYADAANDISGKAHIQTTSTLVKLAEDDYVELCVQQTSGGSLSVNSNALYSPQFAMALIGVG